MEDPQYDYAVIGGDMRQVCLAEELANHQNRVIYYALMAVPDERRCSDASVITEACSFESAISAAQCIICPIPFSKDKLHLSHNTSCGDFPLTALLEILEPRQSFFAGCIPVDFLKTARKNGVSVFDLMKDDTLSYYNTIATAEGALCEAIQRSPLNLYHSSCAVLGYGKCGCTIVSRLKGMSAYIYAYSNQTAECALASTIADRSGNLEDFHSHIGAFDFIFNTIPAQIITKEILKHVKSSATIIDIASAPGGVDFVAAKSFGISAILCPGLPGKYAPSSSAKSMRETIEVNLKLTSRSDLKCL